MAGVNLLKPLVGSTPLGILFRILVLLVLPFYVFVATSSVRDVRHHTESDLADDTRLLAQAVRATMTTHTAMLLSVGEGLLSLGTLERPESGRELIEHMAATDPGMAGFGLARADGQLVLVSHASPGAKLPNLTADSDSRASFEKTLQSDTIQAGHAYFFKTLNQWVIPIRIALRDAQHQVRAVMTAGYRIEGGTAAWARMPLGPDISVLLVHDDGYRLYQHPLAGEETSALYKSTYGQPLDGALLGTLRSVPGRAGIVEARVGGQDMLAAWQRIDDYGLYALTLKPLREVHLKQWASLVTPTLWLLAFLIGGRLVYRVTRSMQRSADAEQQRAHAALVRSEGLLRLSQQAAGMGSYVADLKTGRWESSPLLDQIFGLEPKPEREVSEWKNLLHPQDRESLLAAFKASIASRADSSHEYRIVRARDGATRWLRGWGDIEYDAAGEAVRVVGAVQDITERRRAREAMEEGERRLSAIFHGSPIGITVTRASDGALLDLNEVALRMFGYGREEVIGRGIVELLTFTDKAHQEEGLRRLREAGQLGSWRLDVRKRSGEAAVLELSGRVIDIKDEKVFLCMWIDATERHRAEEQIRKLSQAVEQSSASIVITNTHGDIEYVNTAFTHNTGYSASEVLGRNPRLLQSGETPPAIFAQLWDDLSNGRPWMGELHNQRKDGSRFVEFATISPIRQSDGTITHYVAVKEDVTARKQAEQTINNLAFYDPLTDLPNRRLLMDRLAQTMAAGLGQSRNGSALLFIDLDEFKILNDSLGHDQGDLLLKEVAARLRTCIRDSDTLARLGGDEFIVLLQHLSTNPQEATAAAEVVGKKILVALGQPYQIGGGARHCTSSIGITLFGGTQHESALEPLKRAELAMFQAKAAGRNALRFFDPQMQTQVSARASLEADLREAILLNEFLLHYQPQVSDGGDIVGMEALVRWIDPRRGMVSPAEFIPLAEETGLILPLGNWVLEAACRQLAEWSLRPERAHMTIAVNVSARQFHQDDFTDQVLQTLERTGANPRRLKLELTESALVVNIEGVIAKMNALKAGGVGFSLDDFGTGYSSLSYLKRLPLEQLKIDQGFVRDILVDPNDAAIAKMVVALAESMSLGVIAEGVETEAQRAFLANLGCHSYQGYLFSRPLPIDKLEEFLQRG